LSGGMKRKLLLARALMHDPKILFLDEPTVGLDVKHRLKVWALITELNKKGITIILTTHYLEEAEKLCDKIALINEGNLIMYGSKNDYYEKFGKVAVETGTGLNKKVKLYKTKDTALNEIKKIDEISTLRNTSLEDVFIKLTEEKIN
jgi:ABC-2 type transport system ATP-binding protein